MAALPRERGYPVPWVSCWESGTFELRRTPHSGLVRRCLRCIPGVGRAKIGTPRVDQGRGHYMTNLQVGHRLVTELSSGSS